MQSPPEIVLQLIVQPVQLVDFPIKPHKRTVAIATTAHLAVIKTQMAQTRVWTVQWVNSPAWRPLSLSARRVSQGCTTRWWLARAAPRAPWDVLLQQQEPKPVLHAMPGTIKLASQRPSACHVAWGSIRM